MTAYSVLLISVTVWLLLLNSVDVIAQSNSSSTTTDEGLRLPVTTDAEPSSPSLAAHRDNVMTSSSPGAEENTSGKYLITVHSYPPLTPADL